MITGILLLCLPLAFPHEEELPSAPAPAPSTVAFVGARILPVSGPPIEQGVLVVRNGVITDVGPATSTLISPSALIVDLSGRTLMPGLVDTHSHIGGGWAADDSEPIQPAVRVLDSVNARDPGFRRAQAGGLTTINVMPGSGHLMSGQTLYLKLRGGDTIEQLLVHDDAGRIAGGMKMANGTNSQRDTPFPGTRAKSAALVRARFLEAQAYQARLAKDQGAVDRDLGLEALVEVLEGTRMVHHHTHRHDDILTVLRLAEEFGFRVVLHHVSEAWKVAEEIAAAGVGSSLIMLDSPGGKLEARDIRWSNGLELEKHGAPVAIHTDDWITDSRLFLRSAALAVRGGMSREGALRALTLEGARMLDLDHRVGSLEPGKDADFIVLSGDPFATKTRVLETWVEGKRVFNDKDSKDHLWAVGGRGAGQESVHLCCTGGSGR